MRLQWPRNCVIRVPKDGNKMPIPLVTSKTKQISVIYPNKRGTFTIKHKQTLKMSCSDNKFMQPIHFGITDLVASCFNGSLVYRGRSLDFSQFNCFKNPMPKMLVTHHMCRELTNRVIEVGFTTLFGFIKLYKICFDMNYKNTLYAWYFVNPPINNFRQTSNFEPSFIDPHFKDTGEKLEDYRDLETFFNRPEVIPPRPRVIIDVMEVYRNQTNRLEDILKSKKVAEYYVKKNKEDRRYIAPDHLISKTDMVYFFQQYATYFYENTVPQWVSFSEDNWSEVEQLLMRNMAGSTSRHLIVTGSYQPSTLDDSSGDRHQIYLASPRRMAVPQYLWKMDFDLKNNTGIVYIAMGNPYMSIDETEPICETMPCPGIEQLSDETRQLVYCCSKETFDHISNGFDPIVFLNFDPSLNGPRDLPMFT